MQVAVAYWLACPTSVWEDSGSNLTVDGCIYRDGYCSMQS